MILKCEQCGKDFTSSYIKGRKYCSSKCSQDARRVKKIERICEVCGKTFFVTQSTLDAGWGKYCSHSCSNSGREVTEETRKRLWENYRNGSHLKEVRNKISAKLKGRPSPNRGNPSNFKHSEETIRGMCYPRPWVREAMKNKPKSEEQKKRMRISAKKRCLNPEYWKKFLKACKMKPNKAEKKLFNILQELFPNEYALNVRAEYAVLGGKIPDFFNVNGQKKLIELFGDYWHKDDIPEERVDFFKPFGFSTLIVWEHELQNKPKLVNRLKQFHEV